jgi:hypothetical protein
MGTLYDTALRGMHHQELMRDLGWLSINRITAKQVITKTSDRSSASKKATHIEDRKINGRTVRFFAQGGALCVSELDHNGEQVLTECTRIKTIRRRNAGPQSTQLRTGLTPLGRQSIEIERQLIAKVRRLRRFRNSVRTIKVGKFHAYAVCIEFVNDDAAWLYELNDNLWLRINEPKAVLRILGDYL